jgi:hypothetical protein
MKRGRPRKQFGYLRVAARNFLHGTRCRTPEEAVASGVRTLEGWVEALRDAKDAQVAAMRGQTVLELEDSRYA